MKEERNIFANRRIRLEMDNLSNVSGGVTGLIIEDENSTDSINGIIVPQVAIYTNW